jgi:histidine triad (HIT) family protein
MEDCIFCKFVSHEIPAYVLKEDQDVVVFLSLENHPLVVPKKHIKDIYALDSETGGALMQELVKTSVAVKNGFGCDGVYITQTNEPAAGQDVFHLHFHVYPRWHGKPMNQAEKVDDQERSATFAKLRGLFS